MTMERYIQNPVSIQRERKMAIAIIISIIVLARMMLSSSWTETTLMSLSQTMTEFIFLTSFIIT